VVTNKMERFTHPIVQGMPLFETAGAVVCGDTTPYPKPHPAPLLEAAQRMGVDPAHCVYVGDDERDIVAGHAAGMRTVAATYGYLGTHSTVDAWNAHAQINSPLALLQLLPGA
jgi:phosphoglycolate phosphatase